MSGTIPVTLIGGYLGAGKTTLLNRLLADPRDRRFAVLVNDFGAVNIDAALIANRDGETISLTNGCVCCSIADNLALTLHELADRAGGIEHIVIEASGVADPRKIATYAASHPRLVLDGIVVVADAETLRTRANDKYVGDVVRNQLAAGDIVVLSKTDLIDNDTSRQVREWIEAEVPGVRLFDGCGADALVFSNALAERGPARVPPVASHDHEHGELFATWTFRCDQPLDGAALRAAIEAMPRGVVRAKGIVSLAEASGRRFVLQLVGRRWSLEPEDAAAGDSVIVCIGPAASFDPDLLAALFAGIEAAPFLRNSASG